jgi:xanthine dehydrogenase large subunit
MAEGDPTGILKVVHTDARHDSAWKHVAGSAAYIDDLPQPDTLLHGYLAQSAEAHGRLRLLDVSAVRAFPGVVGVFTAMDVPGKNDVSPINGDDRLFAEDEVVYHGQSLFLVVAESVEIARVAAAKAVVEYEPLKPVLTIAEARAADLKIEPSQTMKLGDVRTALEGAPRRLQGTIAVGGQDHFYLEGHIALATPKEDGDVHVFSSTQNPTEIQHLCAKVLGRPDHAVVVEVRRMGGGFGGKETQCALFAAAAALAAVKTGRPVKIRADRDDDMVMTGKRHDFEIAYDVGFDDDGRLHGVAFDLASRCGCSADLSASINDRAMFHSDNCYFLGCAEILSHRFKTHTVSNTAFRGFGGPQGMMGIERVMDEIAQALGKDPLEVRKVNLYGPGRDLTPYHQTVEDNISPELLAMLVERSDYHARRAEVDAFNASNRWLKKGIALTPVKFGISFTAKHLNQAGALVHLYADGSVMVNHGGTEMGQGLYIKVAQVVADALNLGLDKVKVTSTVTDKVPNTSATAASSGSDLNGMAALDACNKIMARLRAFAAETFECDEAQVVFRRDEVQAGDAILPFTELVRRAYFARISLSATGFYRTPKIHYDRAIHQGRPFYYFAYGAAVSEVTIDTLTGENRVDRVDILHDVGRSLNPAIDRGQIEGGFIQGMGWLTTEELVYDEKGRLRTHAPSTYKIPTARDRPDQFNLWLWDGECREPTIHRSKAVGEPPLMLAISVFSALNQAVQACGDHKVPGRLDAPATPERILMAVEDVRRRAAEA